MAEEKREQNDVVLLCGPTDDGGGVQVLRARENRLEAGEVVRLSQREEEPRLCDVEVLHDAQQPQHAAPVKTETATAKPTRRLTRGGPAQVATKAYRDQWTRVFGDDEEPSSKNMN